jgi:hypothetical protein
MRWGTGANARADGPVGDCGIIGVFDRWLRGAAC